MAFLEYIVREVTLVSLPRHRYSIDNYPCPTQICADWRLEVIVKLVEPFVLSAFTVSLRIWIPSTLLIGNVGNLALYVNSIGEWHDGPRAPCVLTVTKSRLRLVGSMLTEYVRAVRVCIGNGANGMETV